MTHKDTVAMDRRATAAPGWAEANADTPVTEVRTSL